MNTMTLERPVVTDSAALFTIDKCIPLPPITGRGGGRVALYPFAEMKVGDSFAVTANGFKRNGAERTTEDVRGILVNCARGYAKKYNPKAKFATRTIGNTVRVWRIA